MSTRCPVRGRNARSATTGSRWGWSPRARRPAPRARSSSGRSSTWPRGIERLARPGRRGAPDLTWFSIPDSVRGGLPGGAYFLAAVLDWVGRPEDRPVVRTGYAIAADGCILSGLLLTIDRGPPLRFW